MVVPFRIDCRDAGTLESHNKRTPGSWARSSSTYYPPKSSCPSRTPGLHDGVGLLNAPPDRGREQCGLSSRHHLRALTKGDVKPLEGQGFAKRLAVSLAISLTKAVASSLVGLLGEVDR